MGTQTEKLQSRTEIDQEYYEGLFDVAAIMIERPRQRELLERFISGDIHREAGGAIALTFGYDWNEQENRSVPNTKVFWHNHGTFVDKNGAIYEARSDDAGLPQVYIAPNSPEWTVQPCIHPWTYDADSGPYDIEMRFDFINGPHRTAPQNTLEESRRLIAMGEDPVYPAHQTGIEASPELSRRDYLSLVKRGNGHIDGWLHDSETDETSRLYSPRDVLATVHELEERANERQRLEREYDEMRAQYVELRLGERALIDIAA